MIRYRTRDITALYPEPCACGRTVRRMRRITRRSDDMFIIRGSTSTPLRSSTPFWRWRALYPTIRSCSRARRSRSDAARSGSHGFGVLDKVRVLEELEQKLVRAIEHTIGLRVGVRLAQPHTIERSQGKAKRVVDRRQL